MSLSIVVGIATAGRPLILKETLADLALQSRRADRVIVCAPSSEDIAEAQCAAQDATFLIGPRGLTRQRNIIIAAAPEADVVLFLDDDFLLDRDYIAAIDRHMTAESDIVVATGLVLTDGINGAGLSVAEGQAILASGRRPAPATRPVFTGYGCNMAIRLAPLRAHKLEFDERLPLYGWQEDVDLSRRLVPFGRILQIGDAQGVHLGTKSGRNSGVRLGYSQIANPLYLARKKGGGYPMSRALEHAACNMTANLVKSLRPEPYVDRRGRLRGNLLAIREMFALRMRPERVLDL